jgi:hypothetical protein
MIQVNVMLPGVIGLFFASKSGEEGFAPFYE